MKTFIIAAMSADGYIAKDAIHSPMGWTSAVDKKRFRDLTREAGVIVMGSSTFKTIGKALPDRVNIVYTKKESEFPGVETTSLAPQELIKELEARGFKSVAICGGSQIYSMFMKAGVVDTLYLTIEPHIFGKGIPLFNEDMIFHLKLKNVAQSESTGTLLLEYAVDYSGNAKMTE